MRRWDSTGLYTQYCSGRRSALEHQKFGKSRRLLKATVSAAQQNWQDSGEHLRRGKRFTRPLIGSLAKHSISVLEPQSDFSNLHTLTNTHTSPPTTTLPAACSGGTQTWTVSADPLDAFFLCSICTNGPSSSLAGLVQVHLSHHRLASIHQAARLPPSVDTSPALWSLQRVLLPLLESLRASPGTHRSTALLPSNAHRSSTSSIRPPLPNTFPMFLVAFG